MQNQNVTVNEKSPTPSFNRWVDERVRDWMRDHEIEGEQTDYEVAFFDEDSIGEVSCLVVIHAGNHVWRSWESASSPRASLSRSLERLHEDLETLHTLADVKTLETPILTH
jgi:hypothetical protein